MRSSFILHIDSLCILDKMNEEQAGKFIKAIYQYQTTGTLPELDLLLEMAVTPFINQFVRDAAEYKKMCAKNRKNGEKGGRRKKPKGTQKTQSDPVGLDAAPSSVSGESDDQKNSDENPENPNGAYSDSKSDSDSGSVSNSKKKKGRVFEPPTIEDVIKYFTDNGYSEFGAKKAHEYYRLNNWHDSEGKPVKAWKQKMFSVWFKDQYKQTAQVVAMQQNYKSTYDPYDRKNYYTEADYQAALKKLNAHAS